MKRSLVFAAAAAFAVVAFGADDKGQWAKGMDDDAGAASKSSTDVFSLPGASTEDQAKCRTVRDRLYIQSLDGTWNFRLGDKSGPIEVPGNWETQGYLNPAYGNQIAEMTGVYEKDFRLAPTMNRGANRVILRFDGVLFSYRVFLNDREVGAFGSAFQMAQWDVTDFLADGMNHLRVEVSTRSKGWLFDTNDCWALAGIFRSVELFTVPKRASIEDIVFRTPELDAADVSVTATGDFAKVYVSLVDDEGHAIAAKEFPNDGAAKDNVSCFMLHASLPETTRAWSPADPYLYTLVVTLVDENGAKIQRLAEKVGVKTVKCSGQDILLNGKKLFLNGVAWNEIDPKEGRAITYRTRREQMTLMKKACVNTIRTAHYPFGPDFYDLADEMGFLVIDEVPFGSRGRAFLHDAKYEAELIARTENTIRRDRNHASVSFWTFGNENDWTKNTAAVLARAKELDPTRPRGLAQIGSSQFYSMIRHPERDVDFFSGHYLSPDRMKDAEATVTDRPVMQTEYAHACGNGFCDFEDRYSRMRKNPAKWSGGCVWAWIDQSVMHPDSETAEGLKMRNVLKYPDGSDVPKDLRRDMPFELQGNYLDADHFIDSWGDRATDGIVYGDGTPKDGYYLLKRLHLAPDSFFTESAAKSRAASVAEAKTKVVLPLPSSIEESTNRRIDEFARPLLRIGRPFGMDSRIQSLRKQHGSNQQPYLVKPEVLEDGTLRYYYSNPGKRQAWLDAKITVREEGGKTVVDYEFTPNERAREIDVLELGLVVEAPAAMTRVDWAGLGPLTAVPGKNLMNDFGNWSMHRDDYRFFGPRAEVVYALARANGGAEALVLESGTGKVSFEIYGGRILMTECIHAAGWGGKNAPSGLRKMKALTLKGSFKVYSAAVDPNAPDTVPDLTYSRHYGF